MQPGDTVQPGAADNNEPVIELPTPVTDNQPQQIPTASPTNVASAQPAQPTTELPATPESVPAPDQSWQYSQDDQANFVPQGDIGAVSWTASEFIDHDKRASWFMGLAGVAIISSGIVYLITNDFIATITVLIAAGLFGVTAGRKPSTLEYIVDSSGIHIGSKLYEYARFKSFSVIEEGAIDSIHLTPLARFAPPISLYYPPDQENDIIGTLSNYLPHEQRSHDPVDRLMRRIRF